MQHWTLPPFICVCCLRKGGNHAISGRVYRAQFFPFTVSVLFLAASSKRTVRVSERSTVVPRCVRLGRYYCTGHNPVMLCRLSISWVGKNKIWVGKSLGKVREFWVLKRVGTLIKSAHIRNQRFKIN